MFDFATSKEVFQSMAMEFILTPLKQVYSRVQPQVTVHIQMLSLYPGVDSLPYATL